MSPIFVQHVQVLVIGSTRGPSVLNMVRKQGAMMSKTIFYMIEIVQSYQETVIITIAVNEPKIFVHTNRQ